jgi:hypothetical protein
MRSVWLTHRLVICPHSSFGSKGVSHFKDLHQEGDLNEKMCEI